MLKSRPQLFILFIGLLSVAIGVWTMLQTPTMILPAWFLVLFYLIPVFLLSWLLGFILKRVLQSGWHSLTFASLVLSLVCLCYGISEYIPRKTIYIPGNYNGEVMLFVSREGIDDFNVNRFGVGYVSRRTFEKGFSPRILKGKQDITKEVSSFNSGSFATMQGDRYSLEYLFFDVPGATYSEQNHAIEELISKEAVDTSRVDMKR